jgi:phosphohistidine phosphatase SixA
MNTQLIPQMDNQGPVAIMIRHAERHPIEQMIHALEVELTSSGKSDAYNLGQMLARFCPVNIFHSPVPRCKQTADCISEGILSVDSRAKVSGCLLELGGPYITGDWSSIAAAIEKQGHVTFIRNWFDNGLPASLMMSLPEAARIQLNTLVNQLPSSAHSSINITHDWNIMILRAFYFNLRHEDIGDPDFLDGIYASLSDCKISLRYHEHERIIHLSELSA